MDSQHPTVRLMSNPNGPLAPRHSGRHVGVLMLHGFTSSPTPLRPWAAALANAGAQVVLPTLAGHGTRWQDLVEVSAGQWRDDVRRAIDELLTGVYGEPVDELVLAGLSMGGTLALDAAAHRPATHVLLVNPALRLKPLDALGGLLAPVLKHVVPTVAPIADDIAREGVSEHAYPRTPIAPVAELAALERAVRAELRRITARVTVFRSATDRVVPESSMRALRRGLSNTAQLNVHRLPRSYHVATLDHDDEFINFHSISALQETV